jgi:hypothetical protein
MEYRWLVSTEARGSIRNDKQASMSDGARTSLQDPNDDAFNKSLKLDYVIVSRNRPHDRDTKDLADAVETGRKEERGG